MLRIGDAPGSAVAGSWRNIVALSIAFFVLYLAVLIVYRLYFSPIAHFPGPKLAASSRWYEFYYDVILRGQFSKHITELHRIYGPIIRIAPDELHVNDPMFFDTLFTKNQKSTKSNRFNPRFNNDHSVFSTGDAAHHKLRREMLNQFFSKQRVRQREDIVQAKLNYICDKLSDYKARNEPVKLTRMWDAYSADVVMEYAFDFCYDNLISKDFEETFHDAFLVFGEFGALACQFPVLGVILEKLPRWIVRNVNIELDRVLTLCRDLSDEVDKAKIALEQGKIPNHQTVFHGMLTQDVPPEELSGERMRDEAQTMVGAGLTTTSWSLTNACFYIIENPSIQDKLHQELVEAIPDINAENAFDCTKLESLSYLRGCVKEGIRLGVGVSGRMHRTTNGPMPYRKWLIPQGTIVSMNHQDILLDPAIFPCATEMVPDRWLGQPKAFDGSSLERYFVPFGKGDRQCLGMNLANMEIYSGLAHIFRKFRLELFETDRADVMMEHDFFLPCPKLGTQGVRVKVTQTYG